MARSREGSLGESIKGGTADQGICPLSEGQILFCWVGRELSKASDTGQLLAQEMLAEGEHEGR